MSNNIQWMRRSFDSGTVTFGATVLGLVAVFWASLELHSLGIAVPGVRIVAGTLLLLFVPGALLTRLLGISTERFGAFVLFSLGFSMVVLTAINLFANFALPPLGFEAPMSVLPLALLLTLALVTLLLFTYATGTTVSVPRVRLEGPPLVVVLLFSLPALSSAAVIGMDQFGTNLGMFLFVGTVVGLVVLGSTRHLPATLYPLAVFCVSLSTLLHRNLLTDHVVGADIQVSYALSQLLLRTNHWSPDMGGSMMSLPVVTSVPATFTMLTGLELAATFKVVYVFVFALVPVGVFYVTSRLFDEYVAFFGSLFFLFYHGSFYFTPGKQLISELFVVLLILVFLRTELERTRRAIALFALSGTLILSHYGMTYAFGASLLAAVVGLALVRRTVGEFDHDLSVWYPVVLLGTATATYSYTSPELMALIGSIPLSIADQVVTIVLTGSIPGSGASYAAGQNTVLGSLNLYLYVLLTGLVAIGLSWDVLTRLARIRNGETPERVEYAAVALPFFAFLGSSFFVIANLWADRVYQMVLPVLSPYVAVGYVVLAGAVGTGFDRIGSPRRMKTVRDRLVRSQWAVLAVLLAALLALNSGLAFAIAGTAQNSSFNDEATDMAFDTSEREAAEWLESNVAQIERYDRSRASSLEVADSDEVVSVYVDPGSFQLFRSVTPSGYTNVELVYLKSRWQPTLFTSDIGDGYVFVRGRSLSEAETAEGLPPSRLSREEIEEITVPRNLIYSSEGARIVESDENPAG